MCVFARVFPCSHFYVCLTTEARLADAPHGNMWCCGGDRQQNGYGYSNKGVNNDQKHANPKNKMRIGGIVSTGYEGKDVVCRVNDHEFRRWKNQAKYPVRATVSFWDAAVSLLCQLVAWCLLVL